MSSAPSPASPASPAPVVPGDVPVWRPALVLVVGGLVLGTALGALWKAVVRVPAWVVGESGQATMGERALSQEFAASAWFCVLGAFAGLLIGALTWRWFRRRGWVVVPLAIAVATLSGLVAWQVGEFLSGYSFDRRLSSAAPGDRVPIDLHLDALSALLVWPFFASIPVMMASTGLGEMVLGGGRWLVRSLSTSHTGAPRSQPSPPHPVEAVSPHDAHD